jgi:hypothetical protein
MAGLRPSGLPRSGLVQRRFSMISDKMESNEKSVQLRNANVLHQRLAKNRRESMRWPVRCRQKLDAGQSMVDSTACVSDQH